MPDWLEKVPGALEGTMMDAIDGTTGLASAQSFGRIVWDLSGCLAE